MRRVAGVVLADEAHRGDAGGGADVGGVDQQAALAAEEGEFEFGGRGVGEHFEGGAHAAADRVDAGVEVDLEAVLPRRATTRSGSRWPKPLTR